MPLPPNPYFPGGRIRPACRRADRPILFSGSRALVSDGACRKPIVDRDVLSDPTGSVRGSSGETEATMSNDVNYFEIGSPDAQAARAFYGGLFGWTFGEP